MPFPHSQIGTTPERLTLPDKQSEDGKSSHVNAVSACDSATPVAADNTVLANRLTV